MLGGAFEAQHLSLQRRLIDTVDLGERDNLRFFRETAAIGFELAAHGFIGLARMFGSGIDKMEQHAAALDVAQKPVAKTMAVMCSLDQARNVGDNEFPAVASGGAKLRMQGGERIISDLSLRRADRRKKSRFAGVGQADDPGVGNEFQTQPYDALFALLAGIGVARGLIGRGFEVGIAKAAIAAPREADALPGLR